MTAEALPSSQRLLFVTAWLPEPGTWTATAGIARRQRLFVDALKATGCEIDVLLIANPLQSDGSALRAEEIGNQLNAAWEADFHIRVCVWKHELVNTSMWNKYLRPALNYTYQSDLERYSAGPVRAAYESMLRPETTAVLAQRLVCMMPILRATTTVLPVFFDMDDVEHVTLRRHISEPPTWRSKRLQYLQLPALMIAEYIAIRRAAATFVCSELDQRKLQRLFRRDTIRVLPNAMPLREVGPPSQAPVLLILGHYSFGPNRQGADFFIAEVWPLILERNLQARLIVAGADPHLLEGFGRAPDAVEFTGYVQDLDALYTSVRAVVCPILSGGGTRLKVMEAAASGRPIVSTHIGAEGIALLDEDEIMLADGPAQLAEACLRLLNDHFLAEQIGRAAQAAIARLYSRDLIVAGLRDALLATR